MASVAGEKTRVLVVDDTATIRRLIRAYLADDPRIDVVGEAADPYEARDLIKRLDPDVLTLDVMMPRMNGLDFLERLMRLRPMPVVMISTRTAEQSEAAVTALSLGAIDCVDLRRLASGGTQAERLGDLIIHAARARVDRRAGVRSHAAPRSDARFRWNGKLVLIGASTGGVDALQRVLSGYPPDGPPTVIAQHMPPHFIESFAARLDQHTPPRVRVARHGEPLRQGGVFLAPGGRHHASIRAGAKPCVGLVDQSPEDKFVPSVGRLFGSAAVLAEDTVAVMLTGMGRDGAVEMLALRNAGATTIVQSARSAVIDGMPKAARDLGAATEIADIDRIAESILLATSLKPEPFDD